MRIPQPFKPIKIETEGFTHRVDVLERSVIFGANSLPTSIKTQNVELLNGPIRLCGIENGEEIVWDNDYEHNESESFIHSRSAEKTVICGAMQSKLFIVDTCICVEYDGCITFDVKVMPRGRTVAQFFGLQQQAKRQFKLEQLWLEIPLKSELAQMYHVYPNTGMKLADGTVIERVETNSSGFLPGQDCYLPFKPLVWLGNDDLGLGWFADTDKNWQPTCADRAIELVHGGDELVLRVRLLDTQPSAWSGDPARGNELYTPISFKFGLLPTPVKQFPKQPYLHNAMHLDCFVKVKGNYIDFLSQENRFDRLKEKGVTTLILHEKWNKEQNWFEPSEYTKDQLKKIVDECHSRGIKVLTYFGYEISALSPVWSEYSERVRYKAPDGSHNDGWYRVPYQRDYTVCYTDEWQDKFIDGVCRLMDEFYIDGVYLDGTTQPRLCVNTEHGCGYYDENGNLHGTYRVEAIRKMFRRLYAEVEARGGMVNVHASGCVNYTVLPYIHQTWYGENLQHAYTKGLKEDLPLGYFRAEYTGRNMGVPVEFIAYENRPHWGFENALACSIIHGILPRPNNIEGPLDLMSGIWKIVDGFPVAQSEWCPYWKNSVKSSDERIKFSYYRYKAIDGGIQMLVFCANTTAADISGVKVEFGEAGVKMLDTATGKEQNELSFGPFSYKILYVE